jgi:hypothetical protein
LKKKILPKRFVIACNQELQWNWAQWIQDFSNIQTVQEGLNLIFTANFQQGWHSRKKVVIFLNSENSFLGWFCGIKPEIIQEKIKNSANGMVIELKKYQKPKRTWYDFIALIKNNQNEMGLLYIGDKFLIPEIHLKVYSQKFAIAHLFTEYFDYQMLPAPFTGGKMLYKNLNLPKVFHEYHKKIHSQLLHYFSIGIDYKNRVLDYEKNQVMNVYHWSENQSFICRKSKTIKNF